MRFVNKYKEEIRKYVTQSILTYYINTMGCAMNENDSSKYAGMLEDMGFKKCDDEEKANLILFNTCSVRENAENTLYGRLGYLKNRKKEDKNVYLIVAGCMTQQKHILEKLKKSYPYTDGIFGTHSMKEFAENIYTIIIQKKKVREYVEDDEEILEEVPIKFEDKCRASVSIIYGCNNFCTYCIVPYVRGRERSRKEIDILNNIKELADKGYKEITLLGQNVNSYGKDLKDGTTFAKLLSKIEKIDGIDVIKFVSPHPKDFTDDLIEVISHSEKIFKQIHLPLQSGSSRILKLMNRKYTKEDYLNLVSKIKDKCSGEITFATDIIVGFPGETKEDFDETLDVVRKVKFDQIYMYIYSKREGTVAAKIEDNMPYKEKAERLEKLKEVFTEIVNENNEKMINKEYEILVEGKSKNNDDFFTGRTNTNKIVIFKSCEEDVGKIKKVKIIKNNLWYLTGEIV